MGLLRKSQRTASNKFLRACHGSTQFVPIITEDPAVQVIQFCRTPSWMLPHVSTRVFSLFPRSYLNERQPRSEYSPLRRWLTRNTPFLMRFWRWMVFLKVCRLLGLFNISGFNEPCVDGGFIYCRVPVYGLAQAHDEGPFNCFSVYLHGPLTTAPALVFYQLH